MRCHECDGHGRLLVEDRIMGECDECDGTGYVCSWCYEPADYCTCDDDEII